MAVCHVGYRKQVVAYFDITQLTFKYSSAKIALRPGGMAEWTIAVVLKTIEVRASGGSNPSPPAQLYYQFLQHHKYPFQGRCQSGRLGPPAKWLSGQLDRGFESHSPRHTDHLQLRVVFLLNTFTSLKEKSNV